MNKEGGHRVPKQPQLKCQFGDTLQPSWSSHGTLLVPGAILEGIDKRGGPYSMAPNATPPFSGLANNSLGLDFESKRAQCILLGHPLCQATLPHACHTEYLGFRSETAECFRLKCLN